MSKDSLNFQRKSNAPQDQYRVLKRNFYRFDPAILGFASLSTRSASFDGLAVVLDLKNFTDFCDQRDPHLEVPAFIECFLKWLFGRIADELFLAEDGTKVILSSPLPNFGKFLGDGVLLLWDVREVSRESRGNIVRAFDIICSDYERDFVKALKDQFTNPPPKLRCGIAQGQVARIGNNDYVGLCINIASRLQKLGDGAFSFAFTKKGLNENASDDWLKDFRLIRIPIRGVSKQELVYVLRKEFRTLSREDKKRYQA
jgi:class 3 adenylate cyclase